MMLLPGQVAQEKRIYCLRIVCVRLRLIIYVLIANNGDQQIIPSTLLEMIHDI